MSNPKRHHFVPKSYLSAFVENESGFLHVYSKQSDMWRRQKPTQVMVRNKYYHQDWAPDGVDKNILEKRLGEFTEPKGLASLNKLLISPEELTDDDTAHILMYLQFQRIRVPRQAETAKALAQSALELSLAQKGFGQEAIKFCQIEMKDNFRFEFMRHVLGTLSPFMSRMVWELVEASPPASFITTDSPVTFFNVDFPPPFEPGIALYGTFLLFPINTKFLLILKHPEYERGAKGASEKLPNTLEIEDGVIEIRKDIVWDCTQVENHNSLMFCLAQDLIAASNKFTLEKAVGKSLSGF